MKFRTALMWILMLNKRLYKRHSFILMMAVIIGITAVLGFYARQDSSIMKISVFAEKESTAEFIREYTKKDSIIKYIYFNSEEEAVEAVTNNGLDAAWIFNDDIESAAKNFIQKGEPMVKVVQREDTVFLRIAREKLFATLYPILSRALYADYMDETFGETDKNVLQRYYNLSLTNDEIVEIKFNDSSLDADEIDYLVSPIRGLLSIAIFLCAYAALISFKKDRNSGLFSRIHIKNYIYVEIASVFVATINAAIVVLISLKLCGLFTNWYSEIIHILQYVLLCIAFCVIFGELVENINVMSAIMPIISMLIIVLCPVFINTQKFKAVQVLMPTYYYLSAFRNERFLLYGCLYFFATFGLYAIIKYLKKLKSTL